MYNTNNETAKIMGWNKFVGSVVECLKRHDCDQHGLGLKFFLLCAWERHLPSNFIQNLLPVCKALFTYIKYILIYIVKRYYIYIYTVHLYTKICAMNLALTVLNNEDQSNFY